MCKSLKLCRCITFLMLLITLLFFSSVHGVENDPEVMFSFGLIADIHYADRPDEPEVPRYFRTSLDNVRGAVEIFNDKGVDFIVSLGDSIQESKDKDITISHLRRLDEELNKFKGALHYVIGNHDLVDLSREEFLYNTSGEGDSANYFFDVVPDHTGVIIRRNWNLFEHIYFPLARPDEGYRFIVLDANLTPKYTIHHAIVDWLEETLLEAKALGLKAVIFIHQRLDTSGHRHVIQNADVVREVFERVGNLFAVFQGHTHGGNYEHTDGVHYMGIQAMLNFPLPRFAIARVINDGSIIIDSYLDGSTLWSYRLQ